MSTPTNWSKMIPWYMTILCTISLVIISIYLYNNVEWFKQSSLNSQKLNEDWKYRFFVYSTHLSMIKRSLGIITGVAIVFIGMGVSFYAIDKNSDIELTGFGKFTSVTPGLFALCLGTFLIFQSINSKDNFTVTPIKKNTPTENVTEQSPDSVGQSENK